MSTIRAIPAPPEEPRPFKYADGPEQDLTFSLARDLIVLAHRVAAGPDANVVEAARRLSFELKARQQRRFREKRAAYMKRWRRGEGGG